MFIVIETISQVIVGDQRQKQHIVIKHLPLYCCFNFAGL